MSCRLAPLAKVPFVEEEDEAPLDLADLLGIQIALELVEAESMETDEEQFIESEGLQALQQIARAIHRLASECSLSRKTIVGQPHVM